MTKEYKNFKNKLMNSELIVKVTKKGDYITVIPDPCENFSITNILEYVDEKYTNELDLFHDYEENGDNPYKISTEFFDLRLIDSDFFNGMVYNTRYKIIK